MPSKELIALVAKAIINNPPKITRFKDMETLDFSKVVDHTPTAQAAISTILAALLEPDQRMFEGAREWSYLKYAKPIGNDAANGCWRAMLNASPLGEQSE
ncbi:hypothetical protein [Ochrobactrum chromiisoli]|uniref:Uncharacterized protein n=1 Tax=Ochrobactrum chromiisoli TaxID=2993941 RepID=A0ABT3QUR1_9HYPH|nr:hypothetical protein [Ochrobactrum chromiisoli]MCX2699352.1 hypothetical protein [Ochrobactrum chromiisoli]